MNTTFESIEIDCFDCMVQFKQEYQRTDNKAIVFIMKKDIWNMNEDKSEKEAILHLLAGLEELLILVWDCECCGNIIDFLYFFDLCLATEYAKLSELVKCKESSQLIRFITGRKCIKNLYALESISSNELLDYRFVSGIISSINQEGELDDYLSQILEKKSQIHISSIKACFGSYKQAILKDNHIYDDRMKSVEKETEQFCKLASIKSKELNEIYVS